MTNIIFSLVIFNHTLDEVTPLLLSIKSLKEEILDKKFHLTLLICDNSNIPSINFSNLNLPYSVKYNFINNNLGFGAGHNYNIFNFKSIDDQDLIVIVNPDIEFIGKDLFKFISTFKQHLSASCVAPLIINSYGDVQFSAKRNPTLASLFLGRFMFLQKFKLFYNYLYINQNRDKNYLTDIIKTPYLSGSFLLVKFDVYKTVGGFDQRYFLHLEDADFVRMCSELGDTLHIPSCTIVHRWARGSHKSLIQMIYLIRSMFSYFSKWGLIIF